MIIYISQLVVLHRIPKILLHPLMRQLLSPITKKEKISIEENVKDNGGDGGK